jgi:hypothetical protein
MRRVGPLALALVAATYAGDALAQPTYTWRVTQAPVGRSAPAPGRSDSSARVVVVIGGITLAVGIALSWTGIVGLVWEATQHQSLPWAGPVGITSIPVEIVGSVLVLGGALDLDRQRAPGVMSIEPPWVGHLGPPVTLPLLRGEL